MADGYWRIARRPACTLLHCGPGLANGLANLHNARRAHSGVDRAPPERIRVVLVTLGRQVRVHIDQARQKRAAPEIDGFDAGRYRQPAPDLCDALSFDEHHDVVGSLAGRWIHQVRSANGHTTSRRRRLHDSRSRRQPAGDEECQCGDSNACSGHG